MASQSIFRHALRYVSLSHFQIHLDYSVALNAAEATYAARWPGQHLREELPDETSLFLRDERWTQGLKPRP